MSTGNIGITLRNPASAALFAAIVTLVARYIDHRISRKPDNLIDYIKAMIFNGGLAFFIVNSIIGRSGVGMMSQQSLMNAPF